jgi:C4-dicarboxylate-specific signal transduction histidine kinase
MNNLEQIKDISELSVDLQKDRLRSLGELSASILHEINQPLTGIRMSSELSIRLLDPNKETNLEHLNKNLKEILNLTQKVEEIINRMQTFARNSHQDDFAHVNLNISIENAVNLLSHQFSNENISIITNLNEIPMIKGHEIWLDQIFVNLLSNAKYALINENSNQKKEITISSLYNNDDNKVHVIVKDNAGSIVKEIKEKIFEPFFTTKDMAGNGLGLSIIRLIINSLKGTIDLDVDEGNHSSFKISLPIAS